MIRSSLLEDLHDLITSPLSNNMFVDIAVQFDGDPGEPIWTSKLAVYLLYPFLEEILTSADRIILPSLCSSQEREKIVACLYFDFNEQKHFVQTQNEISEKADTNDAHGNQNRDEVQHSKLFACPDCPSTFPNKGRVQKKKWEFSH